MHASPTEADARVRPRWPPTSSRRSTGHDTCRRSRGLRRGSPTAAPAPVGSPDDSTGEQSGEPPPHPHRPGRAGRPPTTKFPRCGSFCATPAACSAALTRTISSPSLPGRGPGGEPLDRDPPTSLERPLAKRAGRRYPGAGDRRQPVPLAPLASSRPPTKEQLDCGDLPVDVAAHHQSFPRQVAQRLQALDAHQSFPGPSLHGEGHGQATRGSWTAAPGSRRDPPLDGFPPEPSGTSFHAPPQPRVPRQRLPYGQAGIARHEAATIGPGQFQVQRGEVQRRQVPQPPSARGSVSHLCAVQVDERQPRRAARERTGVGEHVTEVVVAVIDARAVQGPREIGQRQDHGAPSARSGRLPLPRVGDVLQACMALDRVADDERSLSWAGLRPRRPKAATLGAGMPAVARCRQAAYSWCAPTTGRLRFARFLRISPHPTPS